VDFDKFRETFKAVGLYWLLINQPPLVTSVASAAGNRHVIAETWQRPECQVSRLVH